MDENRLRVVEPQTELFGFEVLASFPRFIIYVYVVVEEEEAES